MVFDLKNSCLVAELLKQFVPTYDFMDSNNFKTVEDQPLIVDIKLKERTLSAFIVRVYLRENMCFKRFGHLLLTRETFVFSVSSIRLYTGSCIPRGIRQTIITSLLRTAVLSSSYYCTKNRFLTPTAAP